MSSPTKEQLLDAYAQLRDAGVDVSNAMGADSLALTEPTAQAQARSRLQALAQDKAWYARLMSGDAEAREEYGG